MVAGAVFFTGKSHMTFLMPNQQCQRAKDDLDFFCDLWPVHNICLRKNGLLSLLQGFAIPLTS